MTDAPESIKLLCKPVDARPVGNLDRTAPEYVELYAFVDALLKKSRIDKIGSYDMLDNCFDSFMSEIRKEKPHLSSYAYADVGGDERLRYVLFDWCDKNCPNCGANVARGLFAYEGEDDDAEKNGEGKEE